MKKLLLFFLLFVSKISFDAEIFKAIEENDIQTVQTYIESGANPNIRDESGSTLLIIASRLGHEHLVKLLINSCVDLNIRNNDGNTALIVAASYGYANILTRLLDAGANPCLINNDGENVKDVAVKRNIAERAKEATLLLFDAVKNEQKDKIISLLNDGADPSNFNKLHFNSLTLSITMGYVEGVRTILETLQQLGKEDLITKLLTTKDILKETPLQLAERLKFTASPKEFYQKIEEILLKYRAQE